MCEIVEYDPCEKIISFVEKISNNGCLDNLRQGMNLHNNKLFHEIITNKWDGWNTGAIMTTEQRQKKLRDKIKKKAKQEINDNINTKIGFVSGKFII